MVPATERGLQFYSLLIFCAPRHLSGCLSCCTNAKVNSFDTSQRGCIVGRSNSRLHLCNKPTYARHPPQHPLPHAAVSFGTRRLSRLSSSQSLLARPVRREREPQRAKTPSRYSLGGNRKGSKKELCRGPTVSVPRGDSLEQRSRGRKDTYGAACTTTPGECPRVRCQLAPHTFRRLTPEGHERCSGSKRWWIQTRACSRSEEN